MVKRSLKPWTLGQAPLHRAARDGTARLSVLSVRRTKLCYAVPSESHVVTLRSAVFRLCWPQLLWWTPGNELLYNGIVYQQIWVWINTY